MSTQRYSVTPHPIETLLTWVKSGEIAIPEIQRPFVWEPVKVRNLLDSLYQGYPVGYLIAWRNPTVRLKDGSTSKGKRILIDGQQRVTALMAALLGSPVLTKDYETVTIRIAFHPGEEKFEVTNPAIAKDPAWLPDVAAVFHHDASITELTDDYAEKNPNADRKAISKVLERLRQIIYNHVGIIELAEDLDIETVTEIFIRVNSAGATLSQADFAMSKIAANETYGGNMLRKAIDYFCHLAVAPEFLGKIEKGDPAFAASEFFPKMTWLAGINDDIYDPSYTDMLRVAFTSQFRRGKLQDLVALLSGRNFETKQYEEEIAEQSFAQLHVGKASRLARSAHSVRRTQGVPPCPPQATGTRSTTAFTIEQRARSWHVTPSPVPTYTGSPETEFDFDMRQIEARGLAAYTDAVIETELPDSFWSALLPQEMDTSSTASPYFLAYQAAQVKLGDLGFLSRDISVRDLVLNRSDVHHVYPRNYLKKQGLTRTRYNQIANYVIAQSEINIAIGDKPPEAYFADLAEQCNGGKKKYGGITDIDEMRANLRTSCLPESLLDGEVPSYDDFLEERRKLMAGKIKAWFEGL